MRHHPFSLLFVSPCVVLVSGFTRIQPQRRFLSAHHDSRPTSLTSSPSKLQMIQFPDLALAQETMETSKSLLHMYENALAQNPVTTKAITSGVLASVGDAIAQVSAYKGKNDDLEPFSYDFSRAICFLAFGAAYTGVFQHFWFDYLGNHICQWGESLRLWGPLRAAIPVEDVYDLNEWWSYFDIVSMLEDPPSNTAVATAKLAVNQFLMIPSFYMPLFFAVTGSLAKLDLEESTERAKSMYIPLLKRNYFYWLPMQFLQFLVVPPNFQILFISFASLLWTVILSSIATDQPAPPKVGNSGTPVTDAITAATDAITFEDVEEALIPQAAREILEDPKFGSTTLGGAIGLFASAANDGFLGAFVSNLLGATIGSGVAVMAATGAIIGLLSATIDETNDMLLEMPETKMVTDGQALPVIDVQAETAESLEEVDDAAVTIIR